jgi:alpha-amylase
MTRVCFYFQVHQPHRLRRYTFFDIGKSGAYLDDVENRRILKRVAERCYRPMNRVVADAIERTDGRFRASYSLSGTVIDQLEAWSPETLDTFVELAETGCVEFLAETAMHSLAFLEAPDEWEEQVEEHRSRIEGLFGRLPTTFRNTELVIDEELAQRLERMGFDALLGEGADHLLGWRSPRVPYRPAGCESLSLLLRSYVLSDDIAFRFSNREWDGYPLMADTFAKNVHAAAGEDEFVGLFMDYETFGEHQWADTGILEFMKALPEQILADERFRFVTPAEVAAELPVAGTLSIPHHVSWADAERDLTAWLGNPMQQSAHHALYELAPLAHEARDAGREDLFRAWRALTTSDHVYYMCTKWFSDGDVHEYFSPYETPHDAFINFMNVLDDLTTRLEQATRTRRPARPSPDRNSK